MNKKIIILFCPTPPNSGAEGIVSLKFVEMLAFMNYHVFWIYNEPINYNLNIVNDKISFYGIKNTLCKKYFKKLDSLIWSIKAYFLAVKLSKGFNFNFTLSRIMPKYGHLPAILFKLKTGIPWIANWSDPLPQSKGPIPYGKGVNSTISKFDKIYLSLISKNADFHTFPCENLKLNFLSYLSIKAEQCFVIPHIINRDVYTQRTDNILRISHIGGGLKERNPRLFFRAIRSIKELYENIPLEVNFVGPIEGNIGHIVKEEKVEDIVKLVGRVPYEDALSYIKDSSIVLIIEAQMENGIFLPSKLADILGYHKPIFTISPQKGVMHDLIENYGGGLFADCMNYKSIKSKLNELFIDFKNNNLTDKKYRTEKLYDQFKEETVKEKFNDIIKKYYEKDNVGFRNSTGSNKNGTSCKRVSEKQR